MVMLFFSTYSSCLTMLIMQCCFLCFLRKTAMDLILDLLDLPHIFLPFPLFSPLFPYLLSPGVWTSPWPHRIQHPGETWMTPTPRPPWAPRDRPVGDTFPRVETTQVNSVRASCVLLHIKALTLLWPLSEPCCLVAWLLGDPFRKVYVLTTSNQRTHLHLIYTDRNTWTKVLSCFEWGLFYI